MIRVRRSAVIDAPIDRVWAVLRDFNSHSAWHPAVGESQIENGEPADQVGCIRNFTLKDGNHIREQLLALSDRRYRVAVRREEIVPAVQAGRAGAADPA